jgi:NADH-quinone oxidoreductase subunit L
MFLALGVGAFTAGIFHVMTHAFFKACLFLGSGSVIHAMSEEQDIRHMGGLKKVMPRTYWTFLISSFAIAGFPPLAGFFSKDEILWKAFADGSMMLWIVGALAALMTAFYMFRMVTLTFEGEPRWAKDKHPHESPSSMTIPLIILAALAVVGGFIGVPAALGGSNAIHHWLHPIFAQAEKTMALPTHHNHAMEYALMAISVAIAASGAWFGWRMFLKNPEADSRISGKLGFIYRLLANKYFIDEGYDGVVVQPIVKTSDRFLYRFFDVRIIDGLVNGTAGFTIWVSRLLRSAQTGVVQNYAAMVVVGIVLILGLIILS